MHNTPEQELAALWDERIGTVGKEFMNFKKLSHLTVAVARLAILRTERKIKFCPEFKDTPIHVAKYCSTVGKGISLERRKARQQTPLKRPKESQITAAQFGIPAEWLDE